MATYDNALLAYRKLAIQFGTNWQTPKGHLIVADDDYSVGITIMLGDQPDPEVPSEVTLDDGTRVSVMTLRVAAFADAFVWPDEPLIFKRISIEDARAKKAELIEAGWGDNLHVSGIGIGMPKAKGYGYQLAIRLIDVIPAGLMETIDGFPCDIRVTGAIELRSLSDDADNLKIVIDETAKTVTLSREGFEFVGSWLTDTTPGDNNLLIDHANQCVIYRGEEYPATITVIGRLEG